MESLFAHLPAITVSGAQATRFGNGGQLDLKRIPAFRKQNPPDGEIVRVRGEKGEFLGLGQVQAEKGWLAILKLF